MTELLTSCVFKIAVTPRGDQMDEKRGASWRPIDVVVSMVLGLSALVVLGLLSITTGRRSGYDPTDSPLIAIMWLGVPLLVLAACLLRTGLLKSMAWVTSAVIPPSIVLIASAIIFYGDSGGAVFWPIGVAYLMGPALWLSLLLALGSTLVRIKFANSARRKRALRRRE